MPHETSSPPKPADLLADYLNLQARAQTTGLADDSASGEVTPYDAGPVQPVDAGLAWEEAVAAAPYFLSGVQTKEWPVPPHWASLVASQEPAIAIAFCLGNFPQMVRSFHLVLEKTSSPQTGARMSRPLPVPALLDWARDADTKAKYPHVPLALGALRLAGNFEQAQALIQASASRIPDSWRPLWDNEKAALLWHQGRAKEAHALWMGLKPDVPVLFNRGMAALFMGDRATGVATLTQMIDCLPETSAWHHLARLYVLLGAPH